MKKINKIKTGIISRNWAVGKTIAQIGKDFYFSKGELLTQKISESLGGKIESLAAELDQLKGSYLKAGQMLSLYGKDLLPPELTLLLEKLQAKTSYLKWDKIKKNIPEYILDDLEVEEDALAAASIGQVHMAYDKKGNKYVLKIQYEGIEKFIDADLKMIKTLISIFKIIPRSFNFDEIFVEIKKMLVQEMDYKREIEFTKKFKQLAEDNYIVPSIFDKWCSSKVICSEYLEGHSVDEAIQFLDQKKRNKLGEDFVLLFFKEIFLWKLVQSDAHFGNYLIKDNKWILLDFGASKKLNTKLAKLYQVVINSLFENDDDILYSTFVNDGAIDFENSDQAYLENYIKIVKEPLQNKVFDWGNSDVSIRLMNEARSIQDKVKFNFIPHEGIFIDRKIAGVYYMLKKLRAQLNMYKTYQEFKESTLVIDANLA